MHSVKICKNQTVTTSNEVNAIKSPYTNCIEKNHIILLECANIIHTFEKVRNAVTSQWTSVH
jgi:hypothetical protein